MRDVTSVGLALGLEEVPEDGVGLHAARLALLSIRRCKECTDLST
jgi:hypothetical protein